MANPTEVATTTDPAGLVTALTRDARGREIQWMEPGRKTEPYSGVPREPVGMIAIRSFADVTPPGYLRCHCGQSQGALRDAGL